MLHDKCYIKRIFIKYEHKRFISNLYSVLEKSEKARESINYRWSKIKQNTNVLRTNEKRNTIKERKEKERKEKEYTLEFLSFYSAYPNKKEKSAAFKVWKKLNGRRPEIDVILAAINNQIEWREKAGDEFRPEWKNPPTWLNKGCWEDELTTKRKKDSW